MKGLSSSNGSDILLSFNFILDIFEPHLLYVAYPQVGSKGVLTNGSHGRWWPYGRHEPATKQALDWIFFCYFCVFFFLWIGDFKWL